MIRSHRMLTSEWATIARKINPAALSLFAIHIHQTSMKENQR
jgi:hypothetical protein